MTVLAHRFARGGAWLPSMGREPTGEPISVAVIDVMRIEEGKIVEHWGVPDALTLLGQIGGPVGGAPPKP